MIWRDHNEYNKYELEFNANDLLSSVCVVKLAFESLSVIVNALTLLEVGHVSVCR